MTDLQNVGEDMVPHGCVMHTNGATANLDAIQHEVVVLAADLWKTSTSVMCGRQGHLRHGVKSVLRE